MYCRKCSERLEEDSRFCKKCGEPVNMESGMGGGPEEGRGSGSAGQGNSSAATLPESLSRAKVNQSSVFAALAYIPFLFWLPLVFDSKNAYGRRCANQGMILLLMSGVFQIGYTVIREALNFVGNFIWLIDIVFKVVNMALSILNFGFGIFILLCILAGIVKALERKEFEVPVLGGMKVLDIDVPFTREDAICTVGYFPILFWVPLAFAKDHPQAKRCANQGLLLLILSIGFGIIWGIFMAVISIGFGYAVVGVVSLVWVMINQCIKLLTLIAIIFGTKNTLKGQIFESPVIGKIILIK